MAVAVRETRREFIQSGIAAGMSRKEIVDRANALGLTPKAVVDVNPGVNPNSLPVNSFVQLPSW